MSIGPSYGYRPDRPLFSRGNERSIITSVYNRIALDVSSMTVQHVRLDGSDRFKEVIESGLNNCLTVEANVDQTGRAFMQDIVMSMLDEGCVAIIPVDTNFDPEKTGGIDIETMRTGKILEWFPQHVKVRVYNDQRGEKEDILVPKSTVGIVENPFYAVMNEPNSTMQRLIRKLNLLDAIDEQNSSGKLNLIIQLPYVIKTEARRQQAELRRQDIENQLASSKYGVAYTDGTEHVVQLNRPVENNLMSQIEYLTRKAQEATDAKTAATLAEGEVKAAEERVRTIRSEAETLGAQATADRNAAEEARTAAEAARDAASNSQNGAKASEDAAAASKTDAEAAKTAAVDARDKAQIAKTAAENALESAENSEANAKTYKESAAESAATAQQYSGKPPKPENGIWWIWDAEKGAYVNTNISCELTGPTGNGIQSIQLTQGNHTPGSTDIYTVTMTDGSKYNIAVYNGLNGTGTGDVLGIHFDLVLPASGWSNGSITVAESRLVAAAKYKYLIDAYEASREEYLECNVRPKDISTTGFITFVNDTDPIKDITVNIVRLELSVNAEEGGE